MFHINPSICIEDWLSIQQQQIKKIEVHVAVWKLVNDLFPSGQIKTCKASTMIKLSSWVPDIDLEEVYLWQTQSCFTMTESMIHIKTNSLTRDDGVYINLQTTSEINGGSRGKCTIIFFILLFIYVKVINLAFAARGCLFIAIRMTNEDISWWCHKGPWNHGNCLIHLHSQWKSIWQDKD